MSPIDDLLARLHRAESLTRGPLYSLTVEATAAIERLLAAGKVLEQSHMALHRYHHGPKCEHCAALLGWWDAVNPMPTAEVTA